MDLPDPRALAEALTQALAPLLPYLAQKAGDTAAEEGMKKVWKTFWGRLRTRAADQPAVQVAMDDAEAEPEEEDNLAALRKELRKLLAADAALREEVAGLLGGTSYQATASDGGVVVQGAGHVVAAHGGMAAARDFHLHQHEPPAADTGEAGLREAYLGWVADTTRALFLRGVDPSRAAGDRPAPQLEAVYTALLTETPLRSEPGEPGEARYPGRVETLSAVAQLDRHPRLVLLGDPGSGKSTFANFAAFCLAGGRLDLLTAPLPDPHSGKEGKKRQPWRHGPLLPVQVVLRDFAAQGLPAAGEPGTADHLWQFIAKTLGEARFGAFVPVLERELREQGGLLLLDGFDEVPDAGERRERLKQVVESFARSFGRCRILVTSRPYAYQKLDWRLAEDFAEAVLAPWNDGQIRRFVALWYAQAGEKRLSAEAAAERARQLATALFANDRIRELARRPLLLTLIASVHAWRGGRLPEDRESLYDQAVNLLLDLWEQSRWKDSTLLQPSLVEALKLGSVTPLRQALEDLAFEVHASQAAGVDTADIPQKELLDRLHCLAEGINAGLLIRYLSERTGLLIERSERVYAFPHRTFQEYLAACHLNRRAEFPQPLAGLARRDPDRWREVVLLAGAAASQKVKAAVWPLLQALCPRPADAPGAAAEDAWGAYLAGQVVRESVKLADLAAWDPAAPGRLRDWFVRLLGEPELPAPERAQAGRILAWLGDPRPGVTGVDGMELCPVPAGPFRMGPGQNKGEEEYEHTLPYDYRIGRYPVTVGQFKEYVVASGFEWRIPDLVKDLDNEPVVRVSWSDALDFCHWLTARWREEGRIPADWTVSLPSEPEWEKAARGTDGRRFPWGDWSEGEDAAGRANFEGAGIGWVSAVGCFPGGRSPYGCEEMSGNVWEWTRSLWGKEVLKPAFRYPYVPGDGREDLAAGEDLLWVVRGGAFHNEQVVVSLHYGVQLGLQLENIGFRVVLLPFSSGL
ncbi:MAG TPA: SUMF1/EgtB/PvdO family nonheme iron enzyme [Thermoanaerobaculia bacterium]|nr:SUMF1/EgtB/PvdO family nonheme iron enzyme [Thermoanaerobaculia bacterium]